MKNPVIFTPSNAHLLAGHLWPYHGKGFFHAYTSSEVYIETAACLYRAGKDPVARLTGVFDSDTWQVAFFVCRNGKKCRTHHAHRNHAAEPAATHPTQKETASHSYPDKGRKANCIHAAARRINPQTPGANTATVMLTTDIPPAAFLHTTLNNRLAA